MIVLYIICFIEPIYCSIEGVSITNGTVLADGKIVTESQSIGTVITYQCDPGFILSGSTQRTCEIVQGSPSGEWNGSLPSCIEDVDSLESSFDITVSSFDITVSRSATATQIPSDTGKVVLYAFQHCTMLNFLKGLVCINAVSKWSFNIY